MELDADTAVPVSFGYFPLEELEEKAEIVLAEFALDEFLVEL